jgi:hypothetical protein
MTALGWIATIQHSQQLPHLSPAVQSCTLERGRSEMAYDCHAVMREAICLTSRMRREATK